MRLLGRIALIPFLALVLLLAWLFPVHAQSQSQQDRVQQAIEAMQNDPDRSAAKLEAEIRRILEEDGTSPTGTGAAEQITAFDTDIEILASGDIVVTETLDVVAQGQQVRRGIFRELPRFYTFEGVRQRYDYELIEVTRGGSPEPVSQQTNGNALLWRIGRADRTLEPGPHRYRIRYRVGDAVTRQDGFDELYWNVTGSYWEFPILRATATLRWPDGTEIRELNAYTGRQGTDTGQSTATRNGTTAIFRTTAPLPPKAGMTVSAIVEKGVIAPWSDARLAQLAWIRNGASLMLGLGGLGLLGYYLFTWNRVGRDPQSPPVFARYGPPDGYSPAAVHFIHNRRHKGMTALSAQLLHMGARGEAEIEAEDDVTTVRRLRMPAHPDSRDLFERLVGPRKTGFVMDGTPDPFVYEGVTDWLGGIAKRYSRDYYRRNFGLSLLGMIGSIILVIVVLNAGVSLAGPVVVALMLGVVGLNLLFLRLMPAATNKGSRVSSEIEGFKLYLETAEAGRINTGGPNQKRPPAMSVELYERFLPYAVALDVEKPWTRYFESVMPEAARDYRPSYGRGSAFRPGRRGSPVDFTRAVTKQLTAGVAAAAPVSRSTGSGSFGSSSGGWSSGGGGGGFSGGGGGGGGGGGW